MDALNSHSVGLRRFTMSMVVSSSIMAIRSIKISGMHVDAFDDQLFVLICSVLDIVIKMMLELLLLGSCLPGWVCLVRFLE
jgi:hypothetical protein